jgi:hypothetical protein
VLPIAAWLVWHRPKLRLCFGLLLAAYAIAVVAGGYGPAWIGILTSAGGAIDAPLNLSPSRYLGIAWLLVGVPAAAYLTIKRRIGLAGLALSPFLLPYHYLIGLIDTPPAQAWITTSASSREHLASRPR